MRKTFLWLGMFLCAGVGIILMFMVLRAGPVAEDAGPAIASQGSVDFPAPKSGAAVDWDQPGPYLQIAVAGESNGVVTIDLAARSNFKAPPSARAAPVPFSLLALSRNLIRDQLPMAQPCGLQPQL